MLKFIYLIKVYLKYLNIFSYKLLNNGESMVDIRKRVKKIGFTMSSIIWKEFI